jgi:hypothetical protein
MIDLNQLVDDLIEENPEATIKDYLDVKADIEAVQSV